MAHSADRWVRPRAIEYPGPKGASPSTQTRRLLKPYHRRPLPPLAFPDFSASCTPMKIGVLGSGDVGRTLGGGFLKHGHEVMMGTSRPAKLADWAKTNPKGRLGSFADAAKFGELIVLAVKGTVAPEAVRSAGPSNLTG